MFVYVRWNKQLNNQAIKTFSIFPRAMNKHYSTHGEIQWRKFHHEKYWERKRKRTTKSIYFARIKNWIELQFYGKNHVFFSEILFIGFFPTKCYLMPAITIWINLSYFKFNEFQFTNYYTQKTRIVLETCTWCQKIEFEKNGKSV